MPIQEAGVLRGCHGNSDPPLLPPPYSSKPPLPYLTLCNLLIWNRALATRTQGAGDSLWKWNNPSRSRMEAGGGGQSEQVTAGWTVMRWRGGKRLCETHTCRLSSSLRLFWSQPPLLPRLVNVGVAAVFPYQRLWSASSEPGGLTSIMDLGPQTHAHNTHREHRVQSGDSEVKSIGGVHVRVLGRLGDTDALLCLFRSAHIHCVATCADESWFQAGNRFWS